MNNAIETKKLANVTGYIVPDYDAPNPRKEFDQLGTMLCDHPRYDLGDEKGDFSDFIDTVAPSDDSARLERIADAQDYFFDRPYMLAQLEKIKDATIDKILQSAVYLNLYLYDHSGITISAAPYSCSWDSGQVGVIFMPLKTAAENWPSLSGADLESAALNCLRAEVAEYDQFLTGDVYGYIIEDKQGETLDSCFGFFGLDIAIQEMEPALQWCEKEAIENTARDDQWLEADLIAA